MAAAPGLRPRRGSSPPGRSWTRARVPAGLAISSLGGLAGDVVLAGRFDRARAVRRPGRSRRLGGSRPGNPRSPPGRARASTAPDSRGGNSPPGRSRASTAPDSRGGNSPPGRSRASTAPDSRGGNSPPGRARASTAPDSRGGNSPPGRSRASTAPDSRGGNSPPGRSRASTAPRVPPAATHPPAAPAPRRPQTPAAATHAAEPGAGKPHGQVACGPARQGTGWVAHAVPGEAIADRDVSVGARGGVPAMAHAGEAPRGPEGGPSRDGVAGHLARDDR